MAKKTKNTYTEIEETLQRGMEFCHHKSFYVHPANKQQTQPSSVSAIQKQRMYVRSCRLSYDADMIP